MYLGKERSGRFSLDNSDERRHSIAVLTWYPHALAAHKIGGRFCFRSVDAKMLLWPMTFEAPAPTARREPPVQPFQNDQACISKISSSTTRHCPASMPLLLLSLSPPRAH